MLSRELPDIIKRHSAPTSLDHAPKGTKCFVFRQFESTYDIYLQISPMDEDPRWEYIGIGPDVIV